MAGAQVPADGTPGIPSLVAAVPSIQNVTTNLGAYPGSQVPRFEKLEITFEVTTSSATNVYWPYDPQSPPGVDGSQGITVNGLFTPDNWSTVYTQPAFYYEEFLTEVRDGRDWFYPTGRFSWKVRFSPDQVGNWQFRLQATDAGGQSETAPASFSVGPAIRHGNIRVSTQDPRYFEFEDGTYFPALGYNLNYRRIDWVDPTLANEDNFRIMQQNGIQLTRTWISQWGLFGEAFSPWKSHNPAHNWEIPASTIRHANESVWADTYHMTPPTAVPGNDYFLWLSMDDASYGGEQWNFTPCVVMGWEAASPAVKPNTNYRVRVRYKEADLQGPEAAGKPFGFAVKLGAWLWDGAEACYAPGTGTVLAATYGGAGSTTSPDPGNPGWNILEGRFNSGAQNFLDKVYLAIENASSGHVFVDHVWIEEDLGNGRWGGNVVYRPSFAPHKYVNQRSALSLDIVLQLAEEYDIYLKPVVLDKNDYVFRTFDFEGNLVPLPTEEAMKYVYFHGDGRNVTAGRWIQKAWFRYLHARWGYSQNIHSWELLNESDPGSVDHFLLADEFGKQMHSYKPDDHLVTTSFWHSFPWELWGNDSGEYSNVDYADYHNYVWPSSGDVFYDAAKFTYDMSMWTSDLQDGPGAKPVIRGETGWLFSGTDLFAQNASNGLWLHNYIWGGINSGGAIEHYWVGAPTHDHIYKDGSHDHRAMFRTYFNFIRDIPLNNGLYQEAGAVVSSPDMRVWGQKDLVYGRAHLWIQNSKHTWKNVVDGVSIPSLSGTVRLDGFQAGKTYNVEWWDTYQTDASRQVVRRETVVASASGAITVNVTNLATDVALRLSPIDATTPTFSDVPYTHPYYEEIESLYRAGYTAGCGTDPLRYCPEAAMNRAESSVFVERGIHTSTYDPPSPTSQVFADLALDSWAAKWVSGLWQDQYTAGCGTNPLVYCPWQGHTRAEGCVFYLRMMNGATYDPAQPATQTFGDVPLDAWYAKWVKAAYDAGLIPACQATPELRFCPNDPLTRALAAYMMVQAKGLGE
jgi:hypothetical protein